MKNKINLTKPDQLSPAKIMQIGQGFFAAKVLLSAVKLDLFTQLAKAPMSGEQGFSYCL